MELKKELQIRWNIFKRNKYMWYYLFFNNVFLAFIDKKGHIFLENKFLYVYRFLNQQLYIIFTIIFFINIFINENIMKAIKNFMIIYIKDIKKELRIRLSLSILITIFTFIIGQIFLSLINFIYFLKIPIKLIVINFIIVSIEIITIILFIFGLRLILKKNIFVYGIYYTYIIGSLALNSVWITSPLTIKILGEGIQEFSIKFWLGRFLLLIISLIIYKVGENKFIKN